MANIIKSVNNIRVEFDSDLFYNKITLIVDDKKVAEGSAQFFNVPNMPSGAVSCLQHSSGGLQCLGQVSSDLIASVLSEYSNLPEVRLPYERDELVLNLSMAYDKYDYMRERDFNNDIGFHESVPVEKEIEAAKQALTEFDKAHPDFIAKLALEKAEKVESNIQSALNA